MKYQRGKKIAAVFLMLLVLAPGAVMFVAPGVTQAQTASTTVGDLPRTLEEVLKKVLEQVKNFGKYAVQQLIVGALNTYTQRLAYDFAVRLSSSASGQKPLVATKPLGTFLKEASADAVTDYLNDFSTQVLGLGLCEPLNPRITLRIKLGVGDTFQPRPKCSWAKFKENVDAAGRTLSTGDFFNGLKDAFDLNASSVGFLVEAHFGALSGAQKAEEQGTIGRLIGQGFKDLTNPISGNTKTPAATIRDAQQEMIRNTQEGQRAATQANLNNTDLLYAVGANAVSTFVNTFASNYIKLMLTKGTVAGTEVVCKTRTGADFDLCKKFVKSGQAGGAELARVQFASLLTPSVKSSENYNPIADFSACPGEGARTSSNCVIDQQFANALSPQADGSYMTVRQAIEQGFLHGDWRLIPPGDVAKNQDTFCYTEAYCYGNLQKLRRARIIPVGWELAAASSANTVGNPVRLVDIMNQFTDCNQGAVGTELDAAHPFCHLIDPDWVLKLPPTQCRALVRGQTLQASGTADRAEVCVDSPSCIAEDTNGNCVSGYGYCTRERNSWHLPGESCPAYFASCEQFENPGGTQLSLLTKTVESNFCSAGNAGCKWYSTAQTAGAWDSTARVYVDRQASECPQGSVGCTQLEQLASGGTQNRIQNSGFELVSTDAPGTPVGWTGVSGGSYSTDGSASFEGVAAAFASGSVTQTDIPVSGPSIATLSFYAAAGGSGSVDVQLTDALKSKLFTLRPLLAPITCFSSAVNQGTCTVVSASAFGVTGEAVRYSFSPLPAYERFGVTFAVPPGAELATIIFNGAEYLDNVQLELAPTATPYHQGGSDTPRTTVRLKVAPDYLACSGSAPAPACANYAPTCRENEAGCESYTPTGSGTRIPAVISSRDRCDAACVGYETFKQERTQWESAVTDPSRIPFYFIPATAVQCTNAEVGCDEFTNLEKAAAGGEAREYYTSLRACGKPDAANDSTYFTWEGSDATGYQLKSFVLRRDASGPTYLSGTNVSACSAAIFALPKNDPAWNPDCRELYDVNGTLYHRLLSRTIISSDECKAFRKSVGTSDDCSATGGTWNATSNACTYFGYVPESRTCPVVFNGCRAYTGNNGGNVRPIVTASFEDGTSEGWTNGVNSNEATVVGGHSLRAGSGATVSKSLVTVGGTPMLTRGRSYQFTFWAKGRGALNIAFTGTGVGAGGAGAGVFASSSGANNKPIVELGPEWQRYAVGPVFLNYDSSTTDTLAFSGFTIDSYIDNVRLTEATDQFTVVKNSWKTPVQCDQTADSVAFPQAQLGCAEYTDGADAKVYLKSFDHICREEAIGCEAFTDRRGTDTPLTTHYNAVCRLIAGAGAQPTDCVVAGAAVCTVAPNTSECRFTMQGDLPSGPSGGVLVYRANDTYTVPSDTVRYLVNDKKFQCDADAVGCTEVGGIDYGMVAKCELASACTNPNGCSCATPLGRALNCTVVNGERSCTYTKADFAPVTTTYRRLTPSNFNTALCLAEAVGCEQWTNSRGGTQYFKDPVEQLCEYHSREIINGVTSSGWFKKGTSEPCDPRFVVSGNFYDIWKNSDTNYTGFAGACKAEFAGCTELIDPVDRPDAFPEGRPYYIIKNDKIDEARDECKGLISQKEGCVAFNDTSDAQSTFNAQLSYEASNAASFKRVAGVDCSTLEKCPERSGPVANDANLVLKVNRDRVCSEWLECTSSQVSVDPATGRESARCLALGLCHEKGPDGACTSWGSVDPFISPLPSPPVFSRAHNQVLIPQVYAARDVTFVGQDFSGYSIPEKYPIDTLRQVEVTVSAPGVTPLKKEFRLAYVPPGISCSGEGTTCGTNNNIGSSGICMGGKCLYGINGFGSAAKETVSLCKAYPEPDSPFPKSVLENPEGPSNGAKKQSFTQAKVCEMSVGGKDCECSYRKVNYGGAALTTYYPLNAELGYKKDGTLGEIKSALCSGGPYNGQLCNVVATGNRTDKNLTCVNGNQQGQCITVERADSVIGEKGYCLEEDRTLRVNGTDKNACLTWLPIDQAAGKDLTNQFVSAAFVPKPGEERYCAGVLGYQSNARCSVPTFINMQVRIGAACKAIDNRTLCKDGPYDGQPCDYAADQGAVRTDTNKSCRTANGNGTCQQASVRNSAYVAGNPEAAPCNFSSSGTRCARAYTEFGKYVSPTGGVPIPGGSTKPFCWTACSGGPYDGQICDSTANQGADRTLFNRSCRSGSTTGTCSGIAGEDPTLCASFAINNCATSSGGSCQRLIADFCGLWSDYCGNLSGTVCTGEVPDGSCKPVTEFAAVNGEVARIEAQKIKFYREGFHDQLWSAGYEGPANIAIQTTVDLDTYVKPLGVNAVLKFEIAEEGIEGQWNNWNPQVTDVKTGRIIGPQPADLLGAYAVGSPPVSVVEYKLAYPDLVLKDQLREIKIASISNQGPLIANCEVNLPLLAVGMLAAPLIGPLFQVASFFGLFDDCVEGIDYRPTGGGTTDSNFDHPFLVLNEKNGWSGTFVGESGTSNAAFKAVFSDSEPKRLIGMRAEAADTNSNGFFYIFGANFHLNDLKDGTTNVPIRWPACGAAAYIGSSNPAAEENIPRAYTNRVNSVKNFDAGFQTIGDANGNIVKWETSCRPWGAIHYPIPATLVTDVQDPNGVKECKAGKGALISSAAVNVLFSQIYSQKQFVENQGYTDASDNYVFYDQPFAYSGLEQTPNGATNASVGAPPQIRAVGSCTGGSTDRSASQKCTEGLQDRLSLNGQDSGTIYGRGSVRANLQFFAFADPNHMPIRSVKVDWDQNAANGIDVDPGNFNYFKNHRGLKPDGTPNCAATAQTAANFALTPNACDDSAPFTYTHVFNYDPTDTVNCRPATQAYPPIGVDVGDTVCIYKPRVQVLDNWNWCNSTSATVRTGLNCGWDQPEPWLSFAGQIIIGP